MPAEPIADGPAVPPSSGGVSAWWRALAIAALLVISVATAAAISMFEQFKAQITHLQSQLRAAPHIDHVAVLLDAKLTPAMLITLDPAEGALQVQRLNDVQEGREDTLQLWAVRLADASDTPARPVSLGVLPSRSKTVRVAVDGPVLDGAKALAISVEDKGGVEPFKGPRLPYLYQGAWVRKAL